VAFPQQPPQAEQLPLHVRLPHIEAAAHDVVADVRREALGQLRMPPQIAQEKRDERGGREASGEQHEPAVELREPAVGRRSRPWP
jgi:hypothetical protein